MPDLLWDDVRWLFDPEVMGSLPDVCVPGALLEDWQSVLDFVVAQDWGLQYSEGTAVLPLPAAATVMSRPAGAECPELRVWPSVEVLAIFRFFARRMRSTSMSVFGSFRGRSGLICSAVF